MRKNKRLFYFEIGLYIFISLIAMVFPLFMRFENGREWNFIFREWIRLIPFFIIFLVNNFILAPKLLFKSKYVSYILSCLTLLVFVALLNNIFIQPRFAPMKPVHEKNIFEANQRNSFISPDNRQDSTFRPENHPRPNRPMPHRLFFSFGIFTIGFFIIGFNSGVKFFVRWLKEEEERNEKEKHYLNAELTFLRHQISPHFFMNTLNNIHALVDIDSEQAKNSILKLSKLMRYLLYETDTDKVSLGKEIEFLESYIELMRLRYDETNLKIDFDYENSEKQIKVPSLLFLPLIENAFKHGVQTNTKSFVNIQFSVEGDYLTVIVRNRNFPKVWTEIDEASGIGLENIRKRLDLIYHDDYSFEIDVVDEIFEVTLIIPVE